MVNITRNGIDAIQARSDRIKRAEEMCAALGEVAYSKALSVICYNLGVSDVKGREYLRILRDAGVIYVKDGVLYPKKKKGGANDGRG